MNFNLTNIERELLREIQQNERHKKNYVKVTVLLGLDKGKSPHDLSDLLDIDDATVYWYVLYFQEQGLDDYLENHYLGFWGKLDSFQLAALQTVLQAHFYTDFRRLPIG